MQFGSSKDSSSSKICVVRWGFGSTGPGPIAREEGNGEVAPGSLVPLVPGAQMLAQHPGCQGAGAARDWAKLVHPLALSTRQKQTEPADNTIDFPPGS